MRAKVLETSVTFEFKGDDADSLVLVLCKAIRERTF